MSSKKLASLLIKVGVNGAEVEKRFRTIEKSAKDLGDKLKTVGKSMSLYVTAPLMALGAASVKAADTQMQAEAKLLNALKGREDMQKRLLAQASELQSRSVIGDEAIIEQQAFLAALGLSEKQIGDTIEAAAQLSAALGIELESAVKNLAKTYGGMTGELGESIPALKNLTTEQLKAGEAINYVNANYKGFAETAAKTGTGPLVQLKNLLGDLAEQIGTILIPTLQKVIGWLKDLAAWFQNLSPAMKETIVTIAAVVAAVGPLLSVGGQLLLLLPQIGAAFTALTGPIGLVIAAVTALASAWALAEFRRAAYNQDIKDLKASAYNNAYQRFSAMTDEELAGAAPKKPKDMPSRSTRAGRKERSDIMKVYQEEQRAYRDVLALREKEKNIVKDTAKTISGYAPTAGGGGGAIRPTGLIGQLEARIAALQDRKPWAKTVEEIAAINKEIATLQQRLDKISNSTGIAVGSATTIALKDSGLGVDLKPGKLLPTIDEGTLSQWRATMIKRAEAMTEVVAQMQSIIQGALGNLAVTIGEGLGNLIVPSEDFNLGKRLLELLGTTLKSLGAALISYAAAMIVFKEALKMAWLNPWVALGAGIATTAAGSALINLANRPPKLAKGGLAYGPTLAVVGDNPNAASDPEVIAPLSKLKSIGGINRLELTGEVEWKLSGSSLRAVLNKENFRLSRLG